MYTRTVVLSTECSNTDSPLAHLKTTIRQLAQNTACHQWVEFSNPWASSEVTLTPVHHIVHKHVQARHPAFGKLAGLLSKSLSKKTRAVLVTSCKYSVAAVRQKRGLRRQA